MLTYIGLPVVRISHIKFFGLTFGMGQLFGLAWVFKEGIIEKDVKLISLHILKKEKPTHGRTLFFRK